MEISTDNAAQIATGLTGIAVFGVYIWRTLARRFSRDGVETAKDRAEVDIITLLRDQARADRERAEKAEGQRNDAIVEVGKLQGEVAILSARLEDISKELHETREELRAARAQINVLAALLKCPGAIDGDKGAAGQNLP